MSERRPDSVGDSDPVSRRQFLGRAARISAAVGVGGFALLGKALAGDASILAISCGVDNYVEVPCRAPQSAYFLTPGEFCRFGTTVTCGATSQTFICDPTFSCRHGGTGETRVFFCNEDIAGNEFRCGAVGGGTGEFICDNRPLDRFWCGANPNTETGVFHCTNTYTASC